MTGFGGGGGDAVERSRTGAETGGHAPGGGSAGGGATARAAWLRTPRPRPGAAWQLFCLPYAGAILTPYGDWGRRLGPGVEVSCVELPGRGARSAEPPQRSVDRIVAGLAGPLLDAVRGPYALFGHSFGALLAFELSHALTGLGRPPGRLIVSGCVPPCVPRGSRRLHDLPDDRLLEYAVELAGAPTRALRAFMLPTLPLLRADLEAFDTYAYAERPALTTPLTAVRGEADRFVPAGSLPRWGELTTGPFRTGTLPGGHMYLREQTGPLLSVVREDLEGAPGPSR
ncbi:thioesterase II family protein [Streptomyces cinnamoneus]|uniref:thioesterase II family protein n=1 Tax=Streptomyces cinnamoneus TaxID=53446 RepID=UPI0015E39642|nr:alpha/beta fold hydrolase [Streptomyces cinnamoneus]